MSDRLERKVEYEANPRARREGLTCTTDLGSRIHLPTGHTLRYSQRAEEKSPASRPGYKPKSTPCRENDQDQTLPKELLRTPACKPTHIDPTPHDPSTNKRTMKSPLGPQAPLQHPGRSFPQPIPWTATREAGTSEKKGKRRTTGRSLPPALGPTAPHDAPPRLGSMRISDKQKDTEKWTYSTCEAETR